jgi:hypothetical protein
MKRTVKGLQDLTLDSFDSCRSDSSSMSRGFAIDGSYDVATREEVNSIDAFISRYPDNHCVIYFSCVGFNPNQTQAFFVVEQNLCHSGVQKFVLMEKDRAGLWVLNETATGWIQ